MTKSNKRLIAGPWVGEFGWELFAWQAYIRSLADHFDEIIVLCRPSSRSLYQDFATKFIDISPPGGLSDSFFMHGLDMPSYTKKILYENKDIVDSNTAIFAPRRIGFPPYTHYSEEVSFKHLNIKPKYKKYGNVGEKKYDYIFHIRNRELRKQDNWSFDNWKKLLKLLSQDDKKIACIGTIKESGYIEGTDDLRNIPLNELFDILRNCEAVFGPSSGPMHLASLCGAPHVVFSTPSVTEKDEIRYTKNWNPLKTHVLYLCANGKVDIPEYIFERYKEWTKQQLE